MHIVLIYAPPWKIANPGEEPYLPDEGPPEDFDADAINEGDFTTAPWGLLSLAAQALREGHRVLTFNLSNYPWQDVETLIRRVKADLYGLSCFTTNRRGVAMLASLIGALQPEAHIAVGGPHASALPEEMIRHHREIDTVIIGEGETTFMEIVHALESGKPVTGIAGTAWWDGDRCRMGPPRQRIKDLDSLVSPLDYFDLRTILTSRGCPGQCTFCCSKSLWGRKVCFHSVDYVLKMLEKAVHTYHQKEIAIKDDTFASNRKRALSICQGILARGLKFDWSCDCRVNDLNEELLYAMRIAGCRRISIGVESASIKILKTIKKQITPEKVLKITRLAQKYGIQVRYYLMVGNRGESWKTFKQSLDFIKKAKPNQFVFCQLHLYPGTEEYEIFQQNRFVTPESFFAKNFFCLTCFAGEAKDSRRIVSRLRKLEGTQEPWEFGIKDYKKMLNHIPTVATLNIDLGVAYLRKGKLNEAERYISQALELGYFLPGLAFNYLACIAAAKLEYEAVELNLNKAVAAYPHPVVVDNLRKFQDWSNQGQKNKMALELFTGDSSEATENDKQPQKPGPIVLNVKKWTETGLQVFC